MTKERRSIASRAIGSVHSLTVFGRRIRVLASSIASLLPDRAKVLDVGCGSGDIANALRAFKPGLTIEGVDVLVRPDTAVPVRQFDGKHLPFGNLTFDYALLIDVLHHTDDPAALLGEVSRVASHVIIKDHYRNGPLADVRLSFMDWVGNAPHGVRLPYNYLSRAEWAEIWHAKSLKVVQKIEELPLYPPPIDWIFGRGLHFVASLVKA